MNETRNLEFEAWTRTLPATHWAKYDLSACRLGWEAAMSQSRGAAVPEPYQKWRYDSCISLGYVIRKRDGTAIYNTYWEPDKICAAHNAAIAAERQKREKSDSFREKLRARFWKLQADLDNERAAAAKAVEALKLNMQWIGAPPTGKYDFDSLREDAWAKGKEALAFYEQGNRK